MKTKTALSISLGIFLAVLLTLALTLGGCGGCSESCGRGGTVKCSGDTVCAADGNCVPYCQNTIAVSKSCVTDADCPTYYICAQDDFCFLPCFAPTCGIACTVR